MPTETAKVKAGEEGVEKALDGVEVTNLSSQIAEQLNLPTSTTGVVVTDVDPSSKMADAGLQKGDVIQEVNHQPVKNVSEFQNTIRKGGNDPLFLVNRGGRTLFIAS
jgi:serine protease Do